MMIKTIVLVTVHKAYPLPALPSGYKPIQVGSMPCISNQFLRDDSGDNISDRNNHYCELTALYWAWKNLDADILGLCHYRRYPGSPVSLFSRVLRRKRCRILDGEQIEMMLKGYDIIMPKKRHYWIETRGNQYAHAHHFEDLEMTERVLQEKCLSFIPAWKHMLASRSGHICNMFIMRRELANEYCAWLFDILFEVERRLDISSYSDNDRRVFGFLGERLLDVWVETKKLRYVEVPMINLEKQRWIRKGFAFVKRKVNRREERRS